MVRVSLGLLYYDFFLLALNFDFLSASQAIGWKEHLRCDPLSVEWDVKPYLNQSIDVVWVEHTVPSDTYPFLLLLNVDSIR